jgi:hypothetical protein
VKQLSRKDKVVNFPTTDRRVTVFTEELHDFIHEKGDNLPLAIVIGAIEIVKTSIMTAALEE